MQDIHITHNGTQPPAATVSLTLPELAILGEALHDHTHMIEHLITCKNPDCELQDTSEEANAERVRDLANVAFISGQLDSLDELLSNTIVAWNNTRTQDATDTEFAHIVKGEEEATTDE